MKQKLTITALFLAMCGIAGAQIVPEDYTAIHSDSSWYFTFDYDTPKPGSDEGMLIITHLCTPDTCISTAERHIQGKRYAKRYVKRHNTQPQLQKHGPSSSTLVLPEDEVSDTMYGITYCEYSTRRGTRFSCDTFAISLPQCPPMSCHRVTPNKSIADHIAAEHPHVKSIRYYTPLTSRNAPDMDITPNVVRYTSNSSKLNPEYLNNAQSIEEMMTIIGEILADSTTTLQSIQIAGYTSPEGYEDKGTARGLNRAIAMRDHIRSHHHLPDSIFEVAGGGRNWNIIYNDIKETKTPGADELIARLKEEPNESMREKILKQYDNGELYKKLQSHYFPAHRIACCTGIYYQNVPDTTAIILNAIVDELMENPSPDYGRLLNELKPYRHDPRALNLQGIIEYRRHHRHAAERAFAKAARMGDEQALINLEIAEYNRNMEKME